MCQLSLVGTQESAAGEEGEWLRGRGAGWREWVASTAREQPVQAPGPGGRQVDRLRAELRADFRSALRHAYLGPECDPPLAPDCDLCLVPFS